MIALAILSEVFMGWTFAILSGAASVSGQSAVSALVDSMSTYWFIFTMASEMAVTLYLVGRNFPSIFRWLVAIQTVIMVLSPTAIASTTWSWSSLIGNGTVMTIAMIVALYYVFMNRSTTDGASKYIVSLMGTYGLMMTGLFLWLMNGDVLLFVLSIVAEMSIYYTIVLDEKRLTNPPLIGWQNKPLWTSALLGGIFVAEFFMGGVLKFFTGPLEEVLMDFFVVDMMMVGFFFIYLMFRRDQIQSRLYFLSLAVILYLGVVTVIISYLLFWGGSLLLGASVLVASGAVLLVPRLTSGEIQEWRRHFKYTIPLVMALVLFELSMGFLYGSAFLPHNSSPLLISVNNLDFAVMMAGDALFFLLISDRKRDLPQAGLFTFALSMVLMPNFFASFGDGYVLISIIVSAGVMMVNIVLLYLLQLRRRTFDAQALAMGLVASDLLMMLGLSFYAIYNSFALLSAAMVVSMVAYFFLVTQRLDTRPVAWYRSSTFLLLVLINGAELAMSFAATSIGLSITTSTFPGTATTSLLGLNLSGPLNISNPLWWLFPWDPAKMSVMAFQMGLSVSTPFAYFWSSFALIMMTTMSPFYVIMMGSEMSYLVLQRYRSAGDRRVRNWALAIIVGIPLFVVLLPFYTPFYIFGMSDMIFSVPLLLFIVSIGAIIAASVLFGRRAQCNLMCMAAHMWTNEYYDQFKPSGDHPRVWGFLRWLSFSLMVLSFGAFALQETGFLSPIVIGMITINPLDFYGMFILNYVWWFFFFLTPVFGAYSCARQGWCGFGTFSGIFNKVFFRIRAKDASICQGCETRECESSCPVAVPLRDDFARKGYSNRISCVGCGDCVEACPHGNVGIIDARDRILRRLGGGKGSEWFKPRTCLKVQRACRSHCFRFLGSC